MNELIIPETISKKLTTENLVSRSYQIVQEQQHDVINEFHNYLDNGVTGLPTIKRESI